MDDPTAPNQPTQPPRTTGEVQALQGESLRPYLEKIGARSIVEVRMLEALIRANRLEIEDAAGFLADAHQHNRDVMDHALVTNMATEEQAMNILAMIYGLQVVNLGAPDTDVEEEIAALISPDQARDWRVLPFGRADNGDLLVAISSPAATRYSEDLKKVLRQRFTFVFATPSELESYIDTIYGRQELAAVTVSQEVTEENYDAQGAARADSETVKIFQDLMLRAVRWNSSDIHIRPQAGSHEILMRIDGELRPISKLNPRRADQLVNLIKLTAKMESARDRRPHDGRFSFNVEGRQIDVRVATAPTAHGFDTAVLRLLDTRKLGISLTDLGMSQANLERFRRAIDLPWGLGLLCGPTGSGKTTTLQAAIKQVQRPGINIITIEDPVETKLPGVVPIEIPRLGDENAQFTFADALRAALRLDPDVIMVGEIRDDITAKTVAHAAQTGHFVYSTLHTNTAVGALPRLRELDIDPGPLAEVVEVVVNQRLVRKVCESCGVTTEPTVELLRQYEAPEEAIRQFEAGDRDWVLRQPRPGGCTACGKTGYLGRTGIHEVLLMSPDLRRAISKGSTDITALTEIAVRDGMVPLKMDAYLKVREGITSLEEMRRLAK